MSHPFHQILVNKDGSNIYIATAQTLKSIDISNNNATLKGEYSINSAVSQQLSTANKKQSKPINEIRAHIQNLILSRNGKYLIGTTNEEKLTLIFDSNDINEIINYRSFPKRPSSIDTTIDDSTLILGDKFGDVYQVPLPGDNNNPIVVNEEQPGGPNDPILGHVSMLVDLVIAENNNQQYIITADRDEHIKVSRYPNSYIVERWLFAHTEFVSSLLLIPWQSTYLVSGGGDNFICLWQWTSGLLVQKFDIVDFVKDHIQNIEETGDHFNYDSKKMNSKKGKKGLKQDEDIDETTETIEINPKTHPSLKEAEISTSTILAVPGLSQILVLCEGTNAIIQLDVRHNISHAATTILPHTVVSITVDSSNKLYIAYDDPEELFAIYQLHRDSPAEPIHSELTKKLIETAAIPIADGQPVALYNINQLRKRPEH